MSKKSERITIRISKEKAEVAEKSKEELDMSVAEQFRESYSFWATVIYGLATGTIGKDEAIEELEKYASVIRGKYQEPRLEFKKAMEELQKSTKEEGDEDGIGQSPLEYLGDEPD